MKRGTTDHSLVIGINKPSGMSSHDVVNRVRTIFNERRVGHTGTLDPLAEGVLPVCVGPATRLDRYLVGHGKRYIVGVTFGFETNTCDIEGEVTSTAIVPNELGDEDFARIRVREMIGPRMQTPPAFSAIKIKGKPAYKRARAGEDVELEARPIEVFDAELLTIEFDENGNVTWFIALEVSKGTYIRSLARDLGHSLGSGACMSSLKRTKVGILRREDCITLEALARLGAKAALDPVVLLGYRHAFLDDYVSELANGSPFPAHAIQLYEPLQSFETFERCTNASRVCISERAPEDGELISIVSQNRLKAIYAYNASRNRWVPDCVFSIGIARV